MTGLTGFWAVYEAKDLKESEITQIAEHFSGLDSRLERMFREACQNIDDYIERINRGIALINHHQHTEIVSERLSDVLLARSLIGNSTFLFPTNDKLLVQIKLRDYFADLEIRKCLQQIEEDLGISLEHKARIGTDFMTNRARRISSRDYAAYRITNRSKGLYSY